MAKTKVRLSLRPDEDWEVDEDEIPVLRHQGLLIEEDAAPSETPDPSAGAPARSRTRTGTSPADGETGNKQEGA